MKKLTIILIVLLGAVGLSSCEPDIIGNGIVEREFRRTAYFNKIELPISAEVILTQGVAKDIEIEAERNILVAMRTTISNNTLRFGYNGNWIKTTRPVRIWIQVPDIEAIRVSGSGRVISDNVILTKRLELRMSGSGLIDLATDVRDNLYADINGSGLIFVEGDATNAYYDISGSGKIEGFGMHTDYSDVNISGSGDCETTAYNRLDVSITGSGDVWFRGKPRVSTRINGSGKVFDAN